jgi:hypothetical protein
MSRRLLGMLGVIVFLAAYPALAERGERGPDLPRANHGQLPFPPERRLDPQAQPEVEYQEGNRIDNLPHVAHDRWYGHDAPADARYRLEQPFEHGRFELVGPEHRHAVVEIDRDRHRFWLGSDSFEVALWDWPLCADWCWDCGNDFVIYDDADHIGWYLLYNVHTGAYVHVAYLGK